MHLIWLHFVPSSWSIRARVSCRRTGESSFCDFGLWLAESESSNVLAFLACDMRLRVCANYSQFIYSIS